MTTGIKVLWGMLELPKFAKLPEGFTIEQKPDHVAIARNKDGQEFIIQLTDPAKLIPIVSRNPFGMKCDFDHPTRI